jgi:hypothetical protein
LRLSLRRLPLVGEYREVYQLALFPDAGLRALLNLESLSVGKENGPRDDNS